MIEITNLRDGARQKTTVPLADGTYVTIELTYRAATQRWTFDIARGDFEAHAIGLSVNANLLRSWRTVIPFGLMCVSKDGADPFDISDFLTGRITLYILDQTGDQTDLDAVEDEIYQAGGRGV